MFGSSRKEITKLNSQLLLVREDLRITQETIAVQDQCITSMVEFIQERDKVFMKLHDTQVDALQALVDKLKS